MSIGDGGREVSLAMVVSRMHRQNIVLVTREDDILKWSIV